MSKRDELIAKYAADIKEKLGQAPDMDLLTKVTIGCGPSIYNADSETVAATDPAELERVRDNYLVKKLGLANTPDLMDAINAAIDTYGRANRNKYRAVLYYMLCQKFDKQAVYN